MQRTKRMSAIARHVRFSGLVVPYALFLVAIVMVAVSLWSRHNTGLLLTTWCVLLGLAFVDVRFSLIAESERSKTGQHTSAIYPRYFGSLIVVWLLFSASIGFGYREPSHAPTLFGRAVFIGVSLFAIAFFSTLLSYYRRASSTGLTVANMMACWCRASIWIGFVTVLLSVLDLSISPEMRKSIFQSIMVLALLPALEWLTRSLAVEEDHVSLAKDVGLIRNAFNQLNPIASLFYWLQRRFSVDLRSTVGLGVAKRSMIPIIGCLALLGWMTTSVVTIDSLQVGIQERFGSPIPNRILAPGIHVKAPWPIDEVHRIERSRVRTMTLGFAGPRAGASLLWTKQHAAEEYNLLLGDGRDLVTVNALLHFTIKDPWVWHYGTQNPEKMLRVAAEQALLKNTVSRSLSGVLSENMSSLVADIESEIRVLVRDYEIGAEIVDLTFQGLHPPVRVSEDYQAVVSAQHERETAILEGRSYETEVIQSAKAEAIAITADADASRWQRAAVARGESDSFSLLQKAHAISPSGIAIELQLQAIEEALENRVLLVIDDRIERDGGVLWFED